MARSGIDARRALTEALNEVLEGKELSVFISSRVLASLNRAGWRLVQKSEDDV